MRFTAQGLWFTGLILRVRGKVSRLGARDEGRGVLYQDVWLRVKLAFSDDVGHHHVQGSQFLSSRLEVQG